jgi:hypothetical protein
MRGQQIKRRLEKLGRGRLDFGRRRLFLGLGIILEFTMLGPRSLAVILRNGLDICDFRGRQGPPQDFGKNRRVQRVGKRFVIDGNTEIRERIDGRFGNGGQMDGAIFLHGQFLAGIVNVMFGGHLFDFGGWVIFGAHTFGPAPEGGIILDMAHHDLDGIPIDEEPWCFRKGFLEDFEVFGSGRLKFEKYAFFQGIVGPTHNVERVSKDLCRLGPRAAREIVTADTIQGSRGRLSFTVTTMFDGVHGGHGIGDQGTTATTFMKGANGKVQDFGRLSRS